MSRTKVVLDFDGFKQLRQSAEFQHAIDEEARKVAERANRMAQFKYPTNYHAVPAKASRNGSIALVSTQGDLYASLDNAQNDTLRKALRAGGA